MIVHEWALADDYNQCGDRVIYLVSRSSEGARIFAKSQEDVDEGK